MIEIDTDYLINKLKNYLDEESKLKSISHEEETENSGVVLSHFKIRKGKKIFRKRSQ